MCANFSYTPQKCSCGASLENIVGVIKETRQVHDIPPVKIEVTDFCLEAKQCPHCQTLNHGNFHDYVNASVCYGPRLKAFATYCRTYQLIPSARTCEIIENIFGLHISEGTLANIIADADSNVEASVKKIANLLKKAKLAHADETGLRIEGKRNWLHVVCNKLHTYYAVHSKRGAEAMEDIGIIPAFRGRLVHDYWQPYYSYKDCKHSLCNTHHLRDLTFVNEEMGKVWAKQMFACLLDMHRAVVLAKKYGRTRLGGGTLKALQQRYEQIIKNGYIEDPSPI
ncbi:MAG: IS66 family transposase [Deltaproteobacteria bacterium]|nr:IS66 family transposase [Deltaproteobacteria bacterium]